MQSFHIVIRALPDVALPSQPMTFAGRRVDALALSSEQQTMPLGVSFEQAAAALESFPRMHFEPDGSFVWVASDEEEAGWQVDGNLYDRDDSLIAIDLKGTCGREQLTRLFEVFRVDQRGLMIELVREAVFLREDDFLAAFASDRGVPLDIR